jgi:asparagine synthase (glutamine-hydrolysing)
MGHRGPDDEGITLIEPECGLEQNLITDNSARELQGYERLGAVAAMPHRIGLGHRRFSLVDTSTAGHQPFWSSSGRVCVAFNGEIYNYVELREELEKEGFQFCTSSDTEVLALAYEAWGVDCFRRFNGFWALSLFDKERRQLLLARDRIGKAPLYLTRNDRGLYWASEIKGLFAILGKSPFSVREQAMMDFLVWGRRDLYHETFYNEIHTFPSAAYAWVEADGSYRPMSYWEIPNKRLSPHDLSPPEAGKHLRELLEDAVRLRLRADVPVSVQLSGGMDSSTLVALAAQIASPVSAYTVKFRDTEADEEVFARQVADRYSQRVTYNVLEPPGDDFLEHADHFVSLIDEPFHGPQAFTNYQIWTTMAAHGFRGNLFGGGGDEVFAGYSTEYFAPYIRSLLQQGRITKGAREFLNLSEHHPGRFGLDYARLACRLIPSCERLSRRLVRGVPPAYSPLLPPQGVQARSGPSDDIQIRMIEFMTDWRMNYWLRIDNQTSMGVPLELRIPFLDYRVVEYGFTMPFEYLMRDGWMKWLLRSAMADFLPPNVTWRRQKAGFPFPLREFLGQFRDRIFTMIQPLDCPYLDMEKFNASYERIRQRDPNALWYLISLAMWWKRCVQGDRLT